MWPKWVSGYGASRVLPSLWQAANEFYARLVVDARRGEEGIVVAADFTHLHVHSEYSLLDGQSRIKRLIQAAQAGGMNALALTDHGGMYGALEFYKGKQPPAKPESPETIPV